MYSEIENVVTSTGKLIEPVRRSLFRRFPVTLTLFVTFGIAATFLGIERIITEISWLDEHPTFILLMGLAILIFTGKLYQKLG